jgi:hypothetical protein
MNTSISLPLTHFYNETYLKGTLEDLEQLKQEKEAELDRMKSIQIGNTDCSCRTITATSIRCEGNDVCICAEYPDDLCETCYALYEELTLTLYGVDPELAIPILHEYLHLINCAIYAKKHEFHILTDDELQTLIYDNYQEGSYLNRCETSFLWSDEGFPSGFGNRLAENEEECDALDFEHDRRKHLANLQEKPIEPA